MFCYRYPEPNRFNKDGNLRSGLMFADGRYQWSVQAIQVNRMSPKRLDATTTSNLSGFITVRSQNIDVIFVGCALGSLSKSQKTAIPVGHRDRDPVDFIADVTCFFTSFGELKRI